MAKKGLIQSNQPPGSSGLGGLQRLRVSQGVADTASFTHAGARSEGIVLAAYTRRHFRRQVKKRMKQMAEWIRTGMKVKARDDSEAELVSGDVRRETVPPVLLSRDDPIRGSSVWFCRFHGRGQRLTPRYSQSLTCNQHVP